MSEQDIEQLEPLIRTYESDKYIAILARGAGQQRIRHLWVEYQETQNYKT